MKMTKTLILSQNSFYFSEIYRDDEQGNFTFKKGDQINYRYEILNELGRGSFGIVIIIIIVFRR